MDCTAKSSEPDTSADWQEVRDHQPTGLTVKMILPKDHYFLGETIEATLEFSNKNSQVKYTLELPAELSTSTTDFHARDEGGKPVVDPRDWQKWFPTMGGGLAEAFQLGEHTENVPVNRTVRFEKPGAYTLFFRTEGIGTEKQSPDKKWEKEVLVSDPVTITIVARTA